jgi:hypothetical protein
MQAFIACRLKLAAVTGDSLEHFGKMTATSR